MLNESPSLRAKREAGASPRERRIAVLHPEDLTDLADGRFLLLSDLEQGWSLGLISAGSTRTQDLLLVPQAALAGADILRLQSCHLLTLQRSRDLGTSQRRIGTEVTCISGNRYFLTVLPVDDTTGNVDNED